MVYLNDYINRRGSSDRGIVDFTYEILGVFTIPDNTIFMSGYTDKGSSAYPSISAQKVGKRDFEYSGGAPGSLTSGSDGWSVSNSNKRLTLSADNGEKGDFIRVVTRAAQDDPVVANNDSGYILSLIHISEPTRPT